MNRWETAGNGADSETASSASTGAKPGVTDSWMPVSRAGRMILESVGDSAATSANPGRNGDMSAENRSSMRYDLGTAGRIAFDGGRSVVDCIIKNLSKTGACLEVPVGVAWPGAFTLEVHDGETREVEAVWSENRIVGVRFLGDEGDWSAGERDSGRLRDHLLRSVQVLEEELDRLRRVIETKL